MDGTHLAGKNFTAMAGGQCNLGAFYLPVSAFSPQLNNCLRHAGQIAEVVGRHKTSSSIDRYIAARPDVSFLRKRSTLSSFAPPIALDLGYHLCGKAVIELGHID